MKPELFADFCTGKQCRNILALLRYTFRQKIFRMNWILLLLTWTITAATPEEPAPNPVDAGIVAWLTETDHDFGELRHGATARFVFKFQNTQAGPIVLETVRTTCGCTAAEWTEAPVEPGRTGEVVIEFDANKSGAFRKKITVFFDKQRKPEVLWVEGEVL